MPRKLNILLPLFSLFSVAIFAQTTQIEFGKNRVQYHDYFEDWSSYDSPNFVTYWYGQARFIGQAVVQMAEMEFQGIEDMLEYRINDKIEIIVYSDLTDLKQSNIGTEEVFQNAAGQTKILGEKMFVYYNGDHNDLRRQVREGIAGVILNNMLFGSNLQEIVQNAVSLNLPPWFKEGLMSYIGVEWNTELDNQLRDVLLAEDFKDFEDFAEKNPKLAGHSLWYFVKERYGSAMVSNLLYLTRINRSTESGFLYVLGSSYDRTIESWQNYFQEKYKGETANMNNLGDPLTIKNKHRLPISNARLSIDGKQVAYVQNEIGKFKLFLQDVATGERKMILKSGHRNPFQETDYNYPLLVFSPSGMELLVIYEYRDIIRLFRYDLNTEESIEETINTQYHRIFSVDYLDNSTLVFSAATRTGSDLFYYYLRTKQSQRITNDFWDDRDATVVNLGNQRGILFSSNRQDSIFVKEKIDSILPTNTFDIFYLDLASKTNELVRVTNTPLSNERLPVAIDTTWFGYTTDISGIENRMIGYLEDYINRYDKIVTFNDGTEIVFHPDSLLTTKLDSAALTQIDTVEVVPIWKKRSVVHFNSNYKRSIDIHQTAPRAKQMLELFYVDQLPQIYVKPISIDTSVVPVLTLFQQQLLQKKDKLEIVQPDAPPATPNTPTPPQKEETDEGVFFQSEFDDTPPIVPVEPQEEVVQDTSSTIDVDNYFFQSEFDEEEMPTTVVIEEDGDVQIETSEPIKINKDLNPVLPLSALKVNKAPRFRSSQIVPYRLEFRTDFVTTRFDNQPLFDGLNTFSGDFQQIGFVPAGLLFKGNVKDVFEDYELEGGIRIPTTFNGAEYFLTFNDRKKRLDKRISAYRRVLRNTDDMLATTRIPPKTENVVLIGQYQVRYPLDVFTSIRGMATLRGDRTIQLATDVNALEVPTDNQQRLGLRGEYVFDNTLDVSVNIKNGTRYKIFGEVVKRFDVELANGFNFGVNEGFMGIVGLDARHYIRLMKHSVLAGRLAATTTFGSEKILYYLGGVDNWLLRSFNQETPPPVGQDFAYQTIASNLRGFQFNIRNGNSFALANAELRVPVLRYIFPKSTKSLVRNFQLVGFYDIGTAWQGLSPFNDENPLNTIIIQDNELNPNVEVKVRYFRDPIVMGYGVGARLRLFGYFLRFDYGWGVETGVIQEPRFYIATGLDF